MSREPTLYVRDWRDTKFGGGKREIMSRATRTDLLAGLRLTCPTCHGEGTEPILVQGGSGYTDGPQSVVGESKTVCSVCGGHGYNPDKVEWLCYYPEFNDEGCLVHHDPDKTRQPRKHQACGWAIPLDALQEEPE